MKKIPFVMKNNFQFIVDFCSSRKFKNNQLNFKDLSIQDRVILSVYMTGLMNQKFTITDRDEKKINQMCNIIFDFNGRRTNNIFNMSMTKHFEDMVAQFFKTKKEYCEYVEQDTIINSNNKKELFKISLNPTEYNITRKLKYKNIDFLIYTIYILGTAKNHTSTILNRFDMHNFSHHLIKAKKMCDKIFKLMNWQYIDLGKGQIGWKSKWKLELNNNDLSKEDELEKKFMEYINE